MLQIRIPRWAGALLIVVLLGVAALTNPIVRNAAVVAGTRIGLRQALMLSAALQAASMLTVALWPAAAPLLLASAATGPAAVLFQVGAAPLMMVHSSNADRERLFSLNAALNIGVAGASKWLGGMLPTLRQVGSIWPQIARWRTVRPLARLGCCW